MPAFIIVLTIYAHKFVYVINVPTMSVLNKKLRQVDHTPWQQRSLTALTDFIKKK